MDESGNENPLRDYVDNLPRKDYGAKASGKGSLIRRRRTPKEQHHTTAVNFVADCTKEIKEKRGEDKLTQMDKVLLDCVHHAVVGLCEGYEHLSNHNWIDEESHGFVPAIDQAAKLQGLLLKYLKELGLERQLDDDHWSRIHRKG